MSRRSRSLGVFRPTAGALAGLCLSGTIALAAFLIANPYALLDYHSFHAELAHQSALSSEAQAKLGANHPDTIAAIYDIACTHAQMIAKAEDRSKQADLAMDWLQQAVAAGYKDVAHMMKDADLDPLRERQDFKKLMADLEVKAAKK